jgi:REP element-mobilizing transposase RayT
MRQMQLLGKAHRLHRIDAALDAGHGARLLGDPGCAQLVVDALHHFDGERYCLIAWCVMPTHVHVVVEPQLDHELGAIVKSWKAYSATQINRKLDRTGPFWASDYFDRFMRDDDQLSATIAYVEGNPVAAKLVTAAIDWPFSSAAERASLRA